MNSVLRILHGHLGTAVALALLVQLFVTTTAHSALWPEAPPDPAPSNAAAGTDGNLPPDASPLPCDEPPPHCQLTEKVPDVLTHAAAPIRLFFQCLLADEPDDMPTRLSEQAIGLQPIPQRPPLIFEYNDRFLAPGFLSRGIELPTGAVWRPSLWVFGTYRTAIQYFDNRGPTNVTEWANRLDLFTQLNLTGTERLLVGIRPLDEELARRREFTSYDFTDGRWRDGWNADVETLFFEGDFGEIFPNLDPNDVLGLDYGFSIGRQPLSLQDGLLVNENRIDAVTVTRNTVYGPDILNLRITGMYGWQEVNRGNNQHDNDAQLFGIFTESDLPRSTVNVDALYVASDDATAGSGFYVGANAIQRLPGRRRTYNSSFHVLASFPTGDESPGNGQGELLFGQVSWTPHRTRDLIYVNAFWAIDQFTSAARGPEFGGPLGQTGILFAAVGLGQVGSPLSNAASEAAGGSIGYQMFFDETRKQLILELGARSDTTGTNDAATAVGARYQQACGQHWIWVVDTFVAKRESFDVSSGLRVELVTKF